jgi:ABC-2 type transport system permease protein
MISAVARKALADHRGIGLGMATVLVLLTVLQIVSYPSLREELEDLDLPDATKGITGDVDSLASPEGYLGSRVFSVAAILIAVVAITVGTAATAAEEDAGTLDLLLAQPVKRWQVLTGKAAGDAAIVAAVALATLPAILACAAFVDLDPLGSGRISEALLSVVAPALFWLALSLAAGAWLPTRSAAATSMTGVLIACYVLSTLGASIGALEFATKLSPLYWGDVNPVLREGFNVGRTVAFLAAAAALLGIALWGFERREITSGGRSWSLLGAMRRRP